MVRKKKNDLTPRQLAVLDDLFSGQMSEVEVLKKHNISLKVYQKWIGQEQFSGQFSFRIDSARRQGKLIVARFIPAAAAKLVELTGSDKEETSRKACLDIMSIPFGEDKFAEVKETEQEVLSEGLDDRLAGKLLRSLAEGDRDGGK